MNYLLNALTTLAIVVAIPLAAQEQPQPPNIVFMLADDMSRDTWGAYGGTNCRTPNIDQLATEGMRFDRAYATVAMCAPFRQELYTGRTPWRTGTLANHSSSVPDTKSIVHYLKPLGYRVGLIGKSHAKPREVYPFEYTNTDKKSADPNPEFIAKSTKFIDSCLDEQKPFCLFIATNDSHAPFTTGDQSAYHAENLAIPPYWIDTPTLRAELAQYYAEITNFDNLVGMVRAELEQRDLWNNTIFMVCSEQGTQLPFAKWTCYDNGLRTGLIAHWSGITPAGSVAPELVCIGDITPTLVAAAGGTLNPDDCDGQSFLPMLRGEEHVLHDFVIGAFTNCNIIGNRDRIFPIRSLRTKHYSLIYNPNYQHQTSNLTVDSARAMLAEPKATGDDIGSSWVIAARSNPDLQPMVNKLNHRPEYELYDLEGDPHELTNLATNPEYESVLKKMTEQLHARLAELNDSDPIATEKSLVKSKKKK